MRGSQAVNDPQGLADNFGADTITGNYGNSFHIVFDRSLLSVRVGNEQEVGALIRYTKHRDA
jgi:hypothetical protein